MSLRFRTPSRNFACSSAAFLMFSSYFFAVVPSAANSLTSLPTSKAPSAAPRRSVALPSVASALWPFNVLSIKRSIPRSA
jgi:hypothetical protein